MIAYGLQIEGAPRLDAALARASELFDRPGPVVLDAVESWFFETETEQFASAGSAGASGGWPALAASTVERKGSDSILVESHALELSLTRPGAPHQIREHDDRSITLGTRRPGAVYHQRGTGRMPARPVIDPSPAQVGRLERDLSRSFVAPLRAAGFLVSEGG